MDGQGIIERGYEARAMAHLIGERLVNSQDAVLKQLIAKYKSGKLTTDELWAGFGQIVGLNDFLGAIQKEVRQGQHAIAKEIGNGS